MLNIVTSERTPIKIWASDLEDGALEQAKNLANLPFIFKHIVLMADSHQGYGMPIGGVLATQGVVIPNAVGVDIGCGMLAVRTSFSDITNKELKEIMGLIRELIPLGYNHQTWEQPLESMPLLDGNFVPKFEQTPICSIEWSSARKQVGTLGGGNHFIEIQKGDDKHIWFMLHSGSRNLGKKVADNYNKRAIELNEKYYSSVPKEAQLAFLPLDTTVAELYLNEMHCCIDFALCNRRLMAENIKKCFNEILPGIEFGDEINIAHNYAAMEHHFGKNVLINRKGATRAYEGEFGIVPGSQGSASYIVIGKGNKESFQSCSHGAGRRMGRKEAQRRLDLKEQQELLNDQNIVHSVRNKTDLDEAPGAYKDIEEVMRNQEDLVEIVVRLKPLGVIKG